jgi:hypothetical protein
MCSRDDTTMAPLSALVIDTPDVALHASDRCRAAPDQSVSAAVLGTLVRWI